MSFLLHAPKKIVVKPEHAEPPMAVSIVLLSVAIFLAVTVVTHMAYMLMESSIVVNPGCKDKIIGFSQHGMYTSPDKFKLALSYCDAS